MPLVNRPPEVTAWVRIGRRTRIKFKQLNAKRAAAYCKSWLLWWTEINPDCRVLEGGQLTREIFTETDDEVIREDIRDWSALKHPGTNGLVNVVAALLLYHDVAEQNDWVLSAEDVCWTFERVLASFSTDSDSDDEQEDAGQQGCVRFNVYHCLCSFYL